MDEELIIKDVSDDKVKKDIFIRIIVVMLIVLVISFSLVYFFGYDFLKDYIKV